MFFSCLPLGGFEVKNKPLTNTGVTKAFPKHVFRIATLASIISSVPVTPNAALLSAFINHLLYLYSSSSQAHVNPLKLLDYCICCGFLHVKLLLHFFNYEFMIVPSIGIAFKFVLVLFNKFEADFMTETM